MPGSRVVRAVRFKLYVAGISQGKGFHASPALMQRSCWPPTECSIPLKIFQHQHNLACLLNGISLGFTELSSKRGEKRMGNMRPRGARYDHSGTRNTIVVRSEVFVVTQVNFMRSLGKAADGVPSGQRQHSFCNLKLANLGLIVNAISSRMIRWLPRLMCCDTTLTVVSAAQNSYIERVRWIASVLSAALVLRKKKKIHGRTECHQRLGYRSLTQKNGPDSPNLFSADVIIIITITFRFILNVPRQP